MTGNMTVALELIARAGGMRQGLTTAQNDVSRFAASAKREVNALKGTFDNLAGKIAALGISFSVVQQAVASAKLDKTLTQIGQTAGSSAAQVTALRSSLFTMATQTGQNVEDLQQGFNNLVQSGLGWKESLETIKAINVAMAVTGANAGTLSGGLSVAATAFQFDLTKPGLALTLLDKMTAAGRLGNAELQNLSDIFARVGVNASQAGMSFDKTLAFVETLSLLERQPERLATLADSTLRLFTNLQYAAQAQQSTGVRFFDPQSGARRDAFAVLDDLKKKYDVLKTDAQRASFIQGAFGTADMDTKKGISALLSGDMLTKAKEFHSQIGSAGGTLKKDLPAAIDNAVDQVGRLKGALRKAADEFAKPINETLANVIAWTMAPKEDGGLGLSGKEMIGYGAAGALGTMLAARYGSKGIKGLAGKLLGHGTSVGAGVAEGKALEMAAGVTPVFVVNWPASIGFGPSGSSSSAPEVAAAGRYAGKYLEALAGRSTIALGATIGTVALAAGTGAYLSKMGWEKNWKDSVPPSQMESMREVLGGGPKARPFEDDLSIRARRAFQASNPEIRNTVPIVIHQYPDRVFAETPDMNTHVTIDLPRSRF